MKRLNPDGSGGREVEAVREQGGGGSEGAGRYSQEFGFPGIPSPPLAVWLWAVCACHFSEPQFFNYKMEIIKVPAGNSLAAQWLGLRASTAGGTGSTPGRGAKIPASCMAQPKKKSTSCTSVSFKGIMWVQQSFSCL